IGDMRTGINGLFGCSKAAVNKANANPKMTQGYSLQQAIHVNNNNSDVQVTLKGLCGIEYYTTSYDNELAVVDANGYLVSSFVIKPKTLEQSFTFKGLPTGDYTVLTKGKKYNNDYDDFLIGAMDVTSAQGITMNSDLFIKSDVMPNPQPAPPPSPSPSTA